jgi:nitrogen regulatory protein P-II 1
MKKIESVIRSERLQTVLDALESSGYAGITVTEVEGHGKQKGIVQQWRGKEYKVSLIPKIKVEIVAKDKDVDKIIKAIIEAARTGAMGDGRIFVSSINDTYKIRTGESGDSTL